MKGQRDGGMVGVGCGGVWGVKDNRAAQTSQGEITRLLYPLGERGACSRLGPTVDQTRAAISLEILNKS